MAAHNMSPDRARIQVECSRSKPHALVAFNVMLEFVGIVETKVKEHG